MVFTEIKTYLAIGFWTITAIHSSYNIYKTYQHNKHETIAVLQNNDYSIKTEKIDTSKDIFNIDDESYIIRKHDKHYIEIGNKKYCMYEKGESEPKDLYTDQVSRVPAEDLHAIIHSKVLQMLNKTSGFLSDFELKDYAIYAAIALGAYILFGG